MKPIWKSANVVQPGFKTESKSYVNKVHDSPLTMIAGAVMEQAEIAARV